MTKKFNKMKKQSVNSKLVFTKASLVELNNDQLNSVNGGTMPYPIPTASVVSITTTISSVPTIGCTFCISSSNGTFTENEMLK